MLESGQWVITLVVSILIFGSSYVYADTLTFQESQISNGPLKGITPTLGNDLQGDYVVFTYAGIPGFPFSGDIMFQRLLDGAPDGTAVVINPDYYNDNNDASGDFIVYTAFDLDTEKRSIQLYQISTGTTTELTNSPYVSGSRIHGDKVVWLDGSSGEDMVMLYDLDLLGTGSLPEVIGGPADPDSHYVEIGDRYVVWMCRESGQTDVCGYDLVSETPVSIASDPVDWEGGASTNGNWIVYEVWQYPVVSGTKIIAKNMATNTIITVVDDGTNNAQPTIDGNQIAYVSDDSGYYNVYLYRLSQGDTSQVTSNSVDQSELNIFGTNIAYVDDRNGNDDVYVSSIHSSCSDSAGPGVDWSGCDKSGENLAGADLSGADLSNTDLSDADLSGANLSSANLDNAIFSGADLSGADITNIDCSGLFCGGSNFSGANLSGTNLSGSNFGNNVDFSDSNLSNADLSGIHLQNPDFTNANLSGADMSGADTHSADYSNANLSGTNLSGANLKISVFTGADLSGADLSGVNNSPNISDADDLHCYGYSQCIPDDGDPVHSNADCDDTDPSIYPGATDTPNDGIDQDCDGTDAALIADLSLTKEVDNPNPIVGDTITFTLTLTNDGPDSLPGRISVSDFFDLDYTFVSANPEEEWDTSDKVWSVIGLDSGQSKSLELSVIVNVEATGENIARLNAIFDNAIDPDSDPDNDDPNEDDYASVTVTVVLDTDGDGVPDPSDACPTEDATGFDVDGDGCIDDSDGDGVTDTVDACPTEDATGFDVDGDGCIDDTDGDGVKDDVDSNPNAFTAINSGDWTDPNVWEGGIVPNDSDDKEIPTGVIVTVSSTILHTGGMENYGTLIITTDAMITITHFSDPDDFYFYGINNLGSISNSGTIAIRDGINGIATGGPSGESGTFDNLGSITISDSYRALQNGGTFTNSGTITVSDGNQSIRNGGHFFNSGTIIIESTSNVASFTNPGGTLDNSGTIEIQNSQGIGIANNEEDTMRGIPGTILNSGIITISNSGGAGISGLVDTIDNSGTIQIQNSGGGGILQEEGGSFTNSGTIIVSNTGIYGIIGYETTSFANSGTITLTGASSNLEGYTTFDNSGTLNIGSGTVNTRDFNNQCGAEINLSGGTFSSLPVNEILCIPNLVSPEDAYSTTDTKPVLVWENPNEQRPVIYTPNLEDISNLGIPIELVELNLVSAQPSSSLSLGNYEWYVISHLDSSYNPDYPFTTTSVQSSTFSFNVQSPTADLSLTKIVDNLNPVVGNIITFTLTLTNDGPDSLPGRISVSDILPAEFTFSSANPLEEWDTSDKVWSVIGLDSGESKSLEITGIVNTEGQVTNTAELIAVFDNSIDPDSTPGNNNPNEDDQDSITFTVLPDADGDGVSDDQDACPGFDDNLDLDSDGIPDGCDDDRDGDGIENTIDLQPDDNTNNTYDDGQTSGTITEKGDQKLSVTKDPTGKVRVKADPSGGTDPAEIVDCENTKYRLTKGDEILLKCGSSIIQVIFGPVEVEFLADDGTVGTTTLETEAFVTFEGEVFTITNNGDISVQVLVNGQEIDIGPGDTFVLEDSEPLSLTLESNMDSFLRSGSSNTNEGANVNMVVRASGDNRALVSFDTSSVSGIVSSAILRLFVVHNGENWGETGRVIGAHYITEAWEEGNGANMQPGNMKKVDFNPFENRGDGPGVTWKCAVDLEIHNQKTDCDIKWNGGSFAENPTDTASIFKDFNPSNPNKTPTESTIDEWVEFDVTSDLSSCLGGDCSWMIKKVLEGQNGRMEFATKEGASAIYDTQYGESVAPKLVLTFGP